MSKWLNKFLGESPKIRTDITDRFNSDLNMSVLSAPPEGIFCKNLENISETRTDITDKFSSDANVSVLSVPSKGLFAKNLENISEIRTDSTDKFNSGANMSVLSVLPERHFGKNLRNVRETGTDKPDITDRFNSGANVSVLSVPSYDLVEKKVPYLLDGDSLHYAVEERMAIAEMDGHQPPARAQRIAYVDAFIAVISTLPYEENQEKNWLEKRIRDAQNWLTAQGLLQPK